LAFMHHIKILNSGRSVVIFPEGGVTKTDKPGTARPGIVHLAQITGAKIIPVRLDGTYSLSIKNFLFKHKPVNIIFGDPLSLTDLFNDLDSQIKINSDEYYRLLAKNILSKIMALSATDKLVAKLDK
jgi:1-acyl-sn-glycerol-3-phosphate acyltransferase